MAYINGNEVLFSAEVHEGADVEIVQETGTSETAVMSQRAVTKQLCEVCEQTLAANYYVEPKSGNVYAHNDAYYASNFIKIYGKKLYLYGTCSARASASGAGYAFYDESKTYISGGENIYEVNTLAEIEIPDGAVYFRYTNKENTYSYVALEISLEEISKQVKEIKGDYYISSTDMLGKYSFEMISGAYIAHASGVEAAQQYYEASPYIKIFGKKLMLYGTCGEIADLAGYAFYDKNKSYISGGRNTAAAAFMSEIEVPENAAYFRYSNKIKNSVVSYLFSVDIIDELAELKGTIQSNPDKWKYVIDKVCCLGDSLTSGAYYANGWTGASIAQNYPYFLSRILNTTVDNHGISGWYPSLWWVRENGVKSIDWTSYNTVIIWLGTNNGLTDTLDTDVNAFTDYNDYAQTETGYYCKIIEYIKAQNNDCLIAIGTVFSSSGDKDITNSVIAQIAEKYGLAVIDFSGFGKEIAPYHANISNVHFGKVGNIAVANHAAETLKNYFAEDITRGEYGISARE